MDEIIYNKLCESGLSRIEQWMDIHDIACISASRSYIKDITDGTAKDDANTSKNDIQSDTTPLDSEANANEKVDK